LVGFPEAGLESPWPTALMAAAMAAVAQLHAVRRQVMMMMSMHW
jgi:hypothetical protein